MTPPPAWGILEESKGFFIVRRPKVVNVLFILVIGNCNIPESGKNLKDATILVGKDGKPQFKASPEEIETDSGSTRSGLLIATYLAVFLHGYNGDLKF